jgi:hypothetical protein
LDERRESSPELFLEVGSFIMEAFRRPPLPLPSSSPWTGLQVNREAGGLLAADLRGLAESRTREPLRGLRESNPSGLRMKQRESSWWAEEEELFRGLWKVFSLAEDLREAASEFWTECFLRKDQVYVTFYSQLNDFYDKIII